MNKAEPSDLDKARAYLHGRTLGRKWELNRDLSRGPYYVWFQKNGIDVYWAHKKEFWRGK